MALDYSSVVWDKKLARLAILENQVPSIDSKNREGRGIAEVYQGFHTGLLEKHGISIDKLSLKSKEQPLSAPVETFMNRHSSLRDIFGRLRSEKAFNSHIDDANDALEVMGTEPSSPFSPLLEVKDPGQIRGAIEKMTADMEDSVALVMVNAILLETSSLALNEGKPVTVGLIPSNETLARDINETGSMDFTWISDIMDNRWYQGDYVTEKSLALRFLCLDLVDLVEAATALFPENSESRKSLLYMSQETRTVIFKAEIRAFVEHYLSIRASVKRASEVYRFYLEAARENNTADLFLAAIKGRDIFNVG